jgi:hypothetical protein
MTAKIDPNDRDSVLYAFHEECARPTAKQIVEWVSRYPEFADDIRSHASVALELATHIDEEERQPDESLLMRGQSEALNALYDADHPVESRRAAAPCGLNFQNILQNAGTDVPHLARELDVGRSVLADLVNGWVLPPICKRLMEALMNRLAITQDQFESAHRTALGNPYLGYAKADRAPEVIPRPCKQVILESSMPSDRKSYWLEEG